MDSITKNRQSPDTLRAMVRRAYRQSLVSATELGHGWFNVAYDIRLDDGSRVVLKIAPPPHVEVMTYERGAMATELAALALIRRHTSVPVPSVHFADTSRSLCDADWFCMPFVEGSNFGMVRDALSPAERDAYAYQLGEITRELNTIRGPGFGPLTGPGVPTWREFFLGMIEGVLSDGERRGVELGWSYDSLRELIASYADSLDEVRDPRFVEWDLGSNNVLIRDGRIACVIDHERAFWGDPLIEAIFVPRWMPAFGPADAVLRGYGKTDFTETERRRRLLYNLYLCLILVIETVYRGFTEPGHQEWASARLTEAMALFGQTSERPQTQLP